MIHDARVIPIDGAPHLDDSATPPHVDSRGHWKDDTHAITTEADMHDLLAAFD